MKTYEIVIKPLSGFGTPLKGDTIFGQFCWQMNYNQQPMDKSLDNLLAKYQTEPFVVFSSAFPRFCGGDICYYALKRPDLPMDEIFTLPDDKKENIKKRKDLKANRWMILQKDKGISSLKELKYRNDAKLFGEDIKAYISDKKGKEIKGVTSKSLITPFSQSHNKINRLTGTTGTEGFAPFITDQHVYFPECELVIFVGIDEAVIDINRVKDGLEMMGKCGFGKDASTGLGRFDVLETSEIDLIKMGNASSNGCYTLAPCVPEKDTYAEMYFTPFTRYGRHGDVLAKSTNPFKNPVIMADEGGIFKPKSKDVFQKPYIGTAITNISKAEQKSVAQGYSLYIPVNVEV